MGATVGRHLLLVARESGGCCWVDSAVTPDARLKRLHKNWPSARVWIARVTERRIVDHVKILAYARWLLRSHLRSTGWLDIGVDQAWQAVTEAQAATAAGKTVPRGKCEGLSHSPEYKAWYAAIRRCHEPREPAYSNYGGRGIRMCDRWRSDFQAFFADMGPRPSPLHSLDRWPDKNGNYEPGNCRWTDQRRQMRNIRRNALVHVGGREMTVAEAAERAAVSESTFRFRLRAGWPVELALQMPTSGAIVPLEEACEIAGIDFEKVTAKIRTGMSFKEAAISVKSICGGAESE